MRCISGFWELMLIYKLNIPEHFEAVCLGVYLTEISMQLRKSLRPTLMKCCHFCLIRRVFFHFNCILMHICPYSCNVSRGTIRVTLVFTVWTRFVQTLVKMPNLHDHQSIKYLNLNATKNQMSSIMNHKQPNELPPTFLPDLVNNLLPGSAFVLSFISVYNFTAELKTLNLLIQP